MSTCTCVFVTPQICQFGAEETLLSLSQRTSGVRE